MENIITNCGLIALRNIDELKNISIRTILNLAEDNNVILYPYKIALSDFDTIALPAIFHSENHFEYISEKAQLKDKAFSGFVLTTKKYDFPKISEHFTSTIIGQTWVAVGVAGLAAGTITTIAGGKALKDKYDQKRDEANRPKYAIPDNYTKNYNIANQQYLQGTPAEVVNYEKNMENQRLAYQSNQYGSLNAGVRGVANMGAEAQQSDMAIGAQMAADKQKAIPLVLNANSEIAKQKAIEYQLNVLNPYYENIARKKARNAAFFASAMSAAGMFGGAMQGGIGGKSQTTDTTTDNNKAIDLANYNATHGDPYAGTNIAQNGWSRSGQYNAIGGNSPFANNGSNSYGYGYGTSGKYKTYNDYLNDNAGNNNQNNDY
jgi:hypothetical protein